jgi:hypothetical protein
MVTVTHKPKRDFEIDNKSIRSPKWINLYLHRDGRAYPGDWTFNSQEIAKYWADRYIDKALASGLEAFYLESGPDLARCVDTGEIIPGIWLSNFLFHIQMPV